MLHSSPLHFVLLLQGVAKMSMNKHRTDSAKGSLSGDR